MIGVGLRKLSGKARDSRGSEDTVMGDKVIRAIRMRRREKETWFGKGQCLGKAQVWSSPFKHLTKTGTGLHLWLILLQYLKMATFVCHTKIPRNNGPPGVGVLGGGQVDVHFCRMSANLIEEDKV